jgi:hypothetical protein
VSSKGRSHFYSDDWARALPPALQTYRSLFLSQAV